MENRNNLNSLPEINGIKIKGFESRERAEEQIQRENLIKEKNDQKEIIRRLRIQNKKLGEQLTILRRKLKQNNIERGKKVAKTSRIKKLDLLLSEALGSCEVCWGEDADCLSCSGKGIPGWRPIDKKLFHICVLPLLQKIFQSEKDK
jgi:hypothetical protein